ncbi:hypothetical protein L7F22_014927 [Adiantum nelumboides]|nr:hypothetical protein [Adiantum nelumboides]
MWEADEAARKKDVEKEAKKVKVAQEAAFGTSSPSRSHPINPPMDHSSPSPVRSPPPPQEKPEEKVTSAQHELTTEKEQPFINQPKKPTPLFPKITIIELPKEKKKTKAPEQTRKSPEVVEQPRNIFSSEPHIPFILEQLKVPMPSPSTSSSNKSYDIIELESGYLELHEVQKPQQASSPTSQPIEKTIELPSMEIDKEKVKLVAEKAVQAEEVKVQDRLLVSWTGYWFRFVSGSESADLVHWLVSGLVHWLVSGQDWLLDSAVQVSLGSLVSFRTGLVTGQCSADMATSIASSSISIKERYPFSLSQLCRLCYPVISLEWDHIEQLARGKNLDELEWLIRLLTTSDPYPVEDMHPIAQIYPLAQVDYTRLVRFLVLLCEEDDEDIENDWTDMSHGMTDNDFIYLDDEDRGLALGLPPNLYNILFP